MLTTEKLLEAFVKNYSIHFRDKEITVFDHTLNGTGLEINFNYPASEQEKAYGGIANFDEIKVHILNYITFIVQYKPE